MNKVKVNTAAKKTQKGLTLAAIAVAIVEVVSR